MQDLKLTPTSYIVLGLLDAAAPAEATPYDLKRVMALSVDNFWSTPHAQVYREPERLAAGGYVTERREETGRRRRFYAITDRGRAALEEWRGKAPDELPEMRDPRRPQALLRRRSRRPRRAPDRDAGSEARRVPDPARRVLAVIAPGQLRALDLGIAQYEAMIDIWRGVAADAAR